MPEPDDKKTPQFSLKDDSDFQELKDSVSSLTDAISDLKDSLPEPSGEPEPTPEPPPSKGWSPTTWGDVESRSKEMAEEIVEKRFSKWEEERETERAAADEKRKKMDAGIDSQFAQLEKAKKIPKIEDQGDENDPGRVARREILKAGVALGASNLVEVYDKVVAPAKSKPPAGASAPVGSSSRGGEGARPKVDYKEIHAKSLSQLAREGMQD